MLHVSRPLTLLALAVCIYVILTWSYRSSITEVSTKPEYIYDENGYRITKEAKASPKENVGHKAQEVMEKQEQPVVVATNTNKSGLAEATGMKHIGQVTQVTTQPAKTYTASSDLPMSTLDPEQQQAYMEDMLHWNRPGHVDGHWPDYEAFEHADYDPNRWEGFEMDREFYESGISKFTPAQLNAQKVYLPYPKYRTEEWENQWQGEFKACDGPKGGPLNDGYEESMRVYPIRPQNFPNEFTGSADAIGIDGDVCLDRVQRYGAYGYNPASRAMGQQDIDWTSVKWGELQDKCFQRNADRFKPSARKPWNFTPDFNKPEGQSWSQFHEETRREDSEKRSVEGKQYRSRTAVLIRTWEGYQYSQNDILTIRAMVSELSLRTGGEYQVFLFVNIKDYDAPIFTDPHAYRRMMIKNVPRELRDIAVLWNEKICKQMYPDVSDWQVYWHQFMSVQWFSQQHPEYDYIWNWEMDVRYIGNHYHFLDKVQEFAGKQPRKYLWERNARYYLPAFHGKSYERYVNDTHAIIEQGIEEGNIRPVWGPMPYKDIQSPTGPEPPHSLEEDDFQWGVGEEADLITLLPIWDPTNTSWTMRNKIWNYNYGVHPVFNEEHPTDDEFFDPKQQEIPRRGYINTVLRLSKGLLQAMHEENLAGRSMQAEMWPTSVALQHGLKAVYAPHPIWSAVKWPARYADAIFNADDGVLGRWGQGQDSIYNQDREVNFRPFSWYYHARFPRILYRRWMGWTAMDGLGDFGGAEWEAEERNGRMCLPQMLLHPVKRDDLDDN